MQSICIKRTDVQIRQTFRLSALFPTDKLCHIEGNYNCLHAHLQNVNTNLEDSLLLLQINFQFQILHLLKTASLHVYRCIYVCVCIQRYIYKDRERIHRILWQISFLQILQQMTDTMLNKTVHFLSLIQCI